MDTESLWTLENLKENAKPKKFPHLTTDLEVDVVVIGAGITGITAALELSNAGKSVAIVEASHIGGVTTSFSTGNLYIPIQPFFYNVARKFDLKTAQLVAKLRSAAIDFIEKQVKQHKIACHFQRRPWYIATDATKLNTFQREIRCMEQMGLGIVPTTELPFNIPFVQAALLPNQARFNPVMYVQQLAEYLQQKNVAIFTNTRVMQIKDASPCHVITQHGKITCNDIIMATHTPIGIDCNQLRIAPYRSYVIGIEACGAIATTDAHLWALSGAHERYSVSIHPGLKKTMLLVAGSHHKVGQEQDAAQHYLNLLQFAQQYCQAAGQAEGRQQVEEAPSAQNISQKISHAQDKQAATAHNPRSLRWSAQHYQSADDLPYIGLKSGSQHVYLATGYFADGLVYGTLAGRTIVDQILHHKNIAQKIFTTERLKPFASLAKLVKENSNVFKEYLSDLPQVQHANIGRTLKKGEGCIITINGEKCAVARDLKNKLHKVSAVCTHMKCIVQWNNAELSWDCPCHGSRFNIDGTVIEGPAITELGALSNSRGFPPTRE